VTIVDCDAHIILPDSMDHVAGDLAKLRPRFRYDEGGHFLDREFPGEPPEVPGITPTITSGSGTNYDGMTVLAARVRDCATMGVDRQVLLPQFTNMRWSYAIAPELATAMARSHNRAMLAAVRQYPDLFIGTILVALQDVPGAVAELEWGLERGLKAAVLDYTYPVREHPYGETLGERRELWPFFARAAELDVPLYLHATQHGHRALNLIRFQRIGLDFFAPHDGHMNLVSLITSGLLDDFPTLRFVHTESGTAFIKPLVQALDARFAGPSVNYDEEGDGRRSPRKLPESARPLVPWPEMLERNQLPPSHYFRRNLYFTIETEEPELAEAVAFLGADRFLFATDYPHNDPGGSMKWRDVEIMRSLKGLRDAEKAAICHANAAKLFGLSDSALGRTAGDVAARRA
jgi:predicted TIM-barrel fold metal-dependent hydrolase